MYSRISVLYTIRIYEYISQENSLMFCYSSILFEYSIYSVYDSSRD